MHADANLALPPQRPEPTPVVSLWQQLWKWEVVAVGTTLLYSLGVSGMYGDDYTIARCFYLFSVF